MLEFDGQPIDPAIVSAQPIDPAIVSAQPIDPAIVSAQPMKPPTQNIDLPQMGCPPVHPESCLSPHNTVPVQPEPVQVPVVSPTPEVYSTPSPMYHSSHMAEPRPQTDSIDTIQVNKGRPGKLLECSYPSHRLFSLLLHGKWYRCIKFSTNRLRTVEKHASAQPKRKGGNRGLD
uniref:Cytoplasmic activation/proliferation-associated protein-1 C term domain-containing protein n=1 Tax=Hucho hucho TaxID=62062 RepID=A0A4W5KUI8_9TELE